MSIAEREHVNDKDLQGEASGLICESCYKNTVRVRFHSDLTKYFHCEYCGWEAIEK